VELKEKAGVILNYIPQGTDKVLEIIKGRNIFVYGDPDMDGLGATYLVIEQLRLHNIAYTYYINNSREHGFKLDVNVLEKLRGCAIFAIDFHMDSAEIRQIVDKGISIVNIDHHNITEPFCYYSNESNGCAGVIINNHYATEPENWRFLSGTGMVYAVFSIVFAVENYETQARAAMVGITLLSDVCPIETREAQYFLNAVYTWDSAESKRLISVVQTEKQRLGTFGVQKHLDREFLDFTFIPVFNALCRFDKNYEALAVLLNEYDFAKRGEITCYKAKQAGIRDYLLDNCKLTFLDGFILCAIDTRMLKATETSYANFIGLVANQIMNTNSRSVLIYITNGTEYIRGSFRGICSAVNYLEILKSCGIFCDGHDGAFGVKSLVSYEVLEQVAKKVQKAEEEAKATGNTTSKYIDVYNLQQFTMVDKNTAVYNQFVRDKFRAYYRYRGNNWTVTKRSETSQYVEYSVDGVTVKAFDSDLTPANSVIRPMKSNGYNVFTLCGVRY